MRTAWCFGAAIGLAAGSACVAFAARTVRRFFAGLIAGLLGYAVVLATTLVATAPSDVSTSDAIAIATLGAALLTPAVALGAAVGAGTAGYVRSGASDASDA